MKKEQVIEKIWAMFDKDKSGVLDANEASLFVDELIKATPSLQPHKTAIFKLMDKDGDGKLTKKELMDILG